MTGPSFHAPHAHDLLISLACFALGITLDLAACRLFRRPLRTRPLLPFIAVLLFFDCTDGRWLHLAALLVYMFYDTFPWDRWRKKFGSKLSALTDVVKASLRRQQTEAFS